MRSQNKPFHLFLVAPAKYKIAQHHLKKAGAFFFDLELPKTPPTHPIRAIAAYTSDHELVATLLAQSEQHWAVDKDYYATGSDGNRYALVFRTVVPKELPPSTLVLTSPLGYTYTLEQQ